MNKEKKIFIDYLAIKGLKLTGQRDTILELFLKTEKHLTVEELYDIVKKKNPDIGHATVFRTLKLLCESDIAREIHFIDKKIRYEHKYAHDHHDHLICIKCQKFIEVVDEEMVGV